MKKSLIFAFGFVIALLTSVNCSAQMYESAVGVRLGYPLSFSYKKFLDESNAVEFYLGTRGYNRYRWVNISGAYLHHQPIEDIEGLQWYIGAGGSIFFWNFDNDFDNDGSSTTTLGIQGYLGLDYTFSDYPISVTVDWIPTIFINGFTSGFGGAFGSIGIRYTID